LENTKQQAAISNDGVTQNTIAVVQAVNKAGIGAYLKALILGSALLSGLSPVWANSSLLESVKQNPQKAKALCSQLRAINAQGLSYNSPQAVAQIAQQQGLSNTDAEILSTYVVGLYCPDIR
jgi:hypothetical protein